jgi:hypothetical protein
VDFSKLKLEVYDLLGLILPGFLALCEGWIFFRGWHAFLLGIGQMTGTGLTLLLLVSFGAGNVVQELGDFTVKLIRGKRHLRSARDRFWTSAEADLVKNAIRADLGHPVTSVDTAFDYCLTKIKDRFAKRDIFVATSDLSRSFVVLSALALIPTFRIAFYDSHTLPLPWVAATAFVAVLLGIFLLMWRRMVRFRDLSDTTVFRVFLATARDSQNSPVEPHS